MKHKIGAISVGGFTLIETIVATCVLALGAVLVYQAFFISLDAYGRYVNYLTLLPWMSEKIWDAQNNLTRYSSSNQIAASGQFTSRGRPFDWDLSYSLADEAKDAFKLYEVGVTVRWQEGQRKASLSRSAYAIFEKK